MKQRIKLSEGELRKIVLESVRTVLNEDFNNDELTNMVREHGGLATTSKYPGKWDARRYNYRDDIANMKPKGYVSPEQLDILNMFNWLEPIAEQALYCQDGGVIVVEEDRDYSDRYDIQKDPNKNKMHDRLNNYLDDKGEKRYPYVGVDKYKNADRREDHFERRGVKTTGPNAGKKTRKKR